MSHHEGVSCDCCNKSNFRGKRYKCLICFDYDLCSTCYDSGVTTTRHQSTHPMQCIVTRSDFELFYGGESLQFDHASSYSFVCPHCNKFGLTDSQLYDHIVAEHSNNTNEVICPVCAVLPGGHPNHMTDDLAGHLTMEHRPGTTTRDQLEEPLGRNIRRMFHPVRNIPPPRSRRAAQQIASSLTSTAPVLNSSNGAATFSSARESFDPIAELLTQLSGVRRAAQQQSVATTASQLQVLQQQLQFERLQVQQARERLERLPRKQPTPPSSTTTISSSTTSTKKVDNTNNDQSKYLLEKYYTETSKKEDTKEMIEQRKQRELFTKEMLFSLLSSETSKINHGVANISNKTGDKVVTSTDSDKLTEADGATNVNNKQFLELTLQENDQVFELISSNDVVSTSSTHASSAESNSTADDVTESLRKQFSSDLLNSLEDNGNRDTLS